MEGIDMEKKPSYNDLLLKINQLEIENKNLKQNEERLESLLVLSKMTEINEREVREFALESVVSLTKSKAGYLHFVNEDQKTIELISWSKGALKLCTAEKVSHYPIDQAGIWADSVRLRRPVVHNYYQDMQDKKGYPKGHFQVIRHLSVPIFDSDKIVAVAGVGNKEAPYDDSDLRQTLLFMNSMWTILKQKRNADEIKILRGIIPLCSFCKNIRDDKGYWERVDVYISKYSEADISHGICPDCIKEHYPEHYKILSKKEKRQHERLTISLPIRLETLTSGTKNVYDVVTRNISASGAFIAAPMSFPHGTRFSLDFKIPNNNIRELKDVESLKGVTGRMVRSNPHGMAIQFDREFQVESLKAL
jgi:hypothetical protein